MKNFVASHFSHIVIMLVVVLGAYLRLYPAFTTYLWGDESISVRIATTTPFKDLLLQNNQYYDAVHPSGYYLLLKSWLLIVPTEDFWLRLLSISFFIPSMYFVFDISKKLKFTTTEKILFLLLFCSHPLLVNNNFQVRMYPMVICLTLGSTAFALSKNKFQNVFLFPLFLAATFYFSYSSIFFIATFVLLMIVQIYSKKQSVFTFINPVISIAVVLILLLPQLTVLSSAFIDLSTLENNSLKPGSTPQLLTSHHLSYNIQKIAGTNSWTFMDFGINFQFLVVLAASLVVIPFISRNTLLPVFALVLVPIVASTVFSIIFFPIFLARQLISVSVILLLFFILVYKHTAGLPKKLYGMLLILISSIYISNSLQFADFHYQTKTVADISSQISSKNMSLVIFPNVIKETFTAYYLPKYGGDTLDILTLKHHNNIEVLKKTLSNSPTTHYALLLRYDCDQQEYCKELLESTQKECLKNNVTCETFYH